MSYFFCAVKPSAFCLLPVVLVLLFWSWSEEFGLVYNTARPPSWCGLLSPLQEIQSPWRLRPRMSVLGQLWSETKEIGLGLAHSTVLILQFWCCFMKHDIVNLTVIMILKDRYYL